MQNKVVSLHDGPIMIRSRDMEDGERTIPPVRRKLERRQDPSPEPDVDFDMLLNIGGPPVAPGAAWEEIDMTTPTRDEINAKLATTEAKIAASEAKVEAKLAEFDSSVKTGFAELRADFAKMQAESHKNTIDIIKWGIGVSLTMVAVTISVLTFVVKTSSGDDSAKRTPPTAQAAPAPIVIYAQPAPVPVMPATAQPKQK